MRVLLAAIAIGVLLAPAAGAAEIQPDTQGESTGLGGCSLREAIDSANNDAALLGCPPGDGDDVIRLGTGTYVLSSAGADDLNEQGDLDALPANGALTIQGTGATTISAQGLGDRVLDVRPGATVTLRGVTLTGGAPPAGQDGGGIRNAGTLTLIDAGVVANRAPDGAAGDPPSPGRAGGGIFSSGTLSLLRTVVSDNVAGTGGRGGDGPPGTGGLTGAAGGPGGGIFAIGPVTLDRSRILRNRAGTGGRGGDNQVGGTGGDGGDGGGLGTAASLTMTGTLVADNSAGAGGAGGDTGNPPGVEGGNGGDGGGVGAGGATSVAFSTLTGNTAGRGGAGGTNTTTPGSPGATGIGSALSGTATLARTVAAGTCAGAVTDGGLNLGGAGCPGSHANPALTAAGAPGPGSPAIDAAPVAGCPATDLAGTSRPQGIGCDIGAFEAAAGTLAFSPAALTFRTARVGSVRRRAVTVSNTGLAGLPVPTAAITGGPHFRLGAVTCSATLAGLGNCSVTVRFTPKRKGSRTGTLRIGTRAFSLSGTGVYRCVVPKLKGKTLVKARKALRKRRCTLGEVTRSGRGRPGRIRSSKPNAGAVRPVGTAVDVVVNRRRS
jgi:hypothetical protein